MAGIHLLPSALTTIRFLLFSSTYLFRRRESAISEHRKEFGFEKSRKIFRLTKGTRKTLNTPKHFHVCLPWQQRLLQHAEEQKSLIWRHSLVWRETYCVFFGLWKNSSRFFGRLFRSFRLLSLQLTLSIQLQQLAVPLNGIEWLCLFNNSVRWKSITKGNIRGKFGLWWEPFQNHWCKLPFCIDEKLENVFMKMESKLTNVSVQAIIDSGVLYRLSMCYSCSAQGHDNMDTM